MSKKDKNFVHRISPINYKIPIIILMNFLIHLNVELFNFFNTDLSWFGAVITSANKGDTAENETAK